MTAPDHARPAEQADAELPTVADCRCRCHVNPGAGCDPAHDTGTSGVPGQPTCGPHAPADEPEIPVEHRCVLPHADPVEHAYGLTCKRHYHWIDATLREILDLWALLPSVIEPGSGTGGPAGTVVEAPAPIRLDVAAITERGDRGGTRGEAHGGGRDRDDVLWDEEPDTPRLIPALASWVATIHEERGIDLPDWQPTRTLAPACADTRCLHPTCVYLRAAGQPVHLGDHTYRGGRWQIRDTVTELVRILRRERPWIVQQPWVDDYAVDLADLHRALARAAGDTMWPKSIGKCPNCQTPLYNTIGLDSVTCRKCKTVWAGTDLVRLRLIHEREQQGA